MSHEDHLCRLCGKQAKLFESHIIPAFVFRWMKQAGHIRSAQSVNKRVQDGAKEYWLCERCEGLLSSFETPFASNIFHPYDADREIKVRHQEWLLKFCVSVSWRALSYLRAITALSEFSSRQNERAELALNTWAKYLRGEFKHVGEFEQHLIPFTEIANVSTTTTPSNINRYLTRTTEINAATTEGSCFIYSKFGPFAVLGFIDVEHPSRWKGSKVERQGWFAPRRYIIPEGFQGYLLDRASRVQAVNSKMSPAQQAKVNATILANPSGFTGSSLFRAMQRDIELFGKDAFTKFDEPNE